MQPYPTPEESLAEVVRQLEDGLNKLPCGARIAFAARCASIAIYIFRKVAPNATKSDIESMQTARNLAKHVASGSYSGDASTDGSNLRNPVLGVASKQPPSSIAARAARAIASVAETVKFSEIAIGVAVETARVLHDSNLPTNDKRKAFESLLDDLEDLVARSSQGEWKYNTPVSQEHFSQIQLGGDLV